MIKRKSLSQKIRFDVFKRDSFKCAYCGNSPPKVVLEVDHIIPVSKGGDNDINNLITACFDCNRGKTNATLDQIPATVVENLDILKKKELQLSEYNKFLKKISARIKRQAFNVDKIYIARFPQYKLSNHFKNDSLKYFLEKLPYQEIKEAMEIATARITDSDKCINYFCGICWCKIRNYGIKS